MKPTPYPSEDLRSVDRELLMAMRQGDALGIGELTEKLGVTASDIQTVMG